MKTINSFRSKLFALALVLVTSVSSFAHDFSVDGIYYNVLDDNNVEVTYKGSSIYEEVEYRDDVVIPDSVLYNGVNYVVASIGKSAFRACSNLTTIHIPDNLTTIGEYAFYECYKLTSVILGNNVTNIEGMAFMYCKALKSITLPNITHIGSSAFNNCLSLDSVTLGNGLRNIADNLFYLCSSLTHITIPDSIECIGEHAFYNCKLLKTIYIPNTVNMIGKYAFSGCSSLDSIHIPNGVTEIGERTFENCTSLQAVNLPKTISSIRYYAFAGCASLTEINIPEGVQKIESNTFENCTSLLKITIPNSVMTIELDAFSNTGYYNDANNWEEDVLYISNCLIEAKNSIAGDYNIKQGTRIIADYALFGCHNLTSITFPESLKSIGDAAFYECTNLSTVNMSDSLQNIGSMAFAYCELLNPVTIPVGVKTFGTEVFYGCKSLVSVIWNAKECQDFGDPFVAPFYRISSKITSITFGDEVEYIPAGMCYGLSALSSVTIPINVKCIGKDAFESCSSIASITWNAKHYCDTLDYSPFEDISYNIKSFTFGEEIETIPPYVCKEMREITSITIPEGVKSIGRHAFNYCLGIPSVTIPKGVTTIGSAAFFHTQIRSVIVPEGVTEIGGWAFSECYGLNKIELPSTLKSIGNSAFKETYYIDTLICKALVPPTMGDLLVFEGLKKERTSLFVPVMSIELYRKTNIWKDFGQILPITWSEECEEYKHVNMSVVVFGNSIIFDLSNNHTIEPPYVDSVWIVNTEQEPVRKLYAQSGDTIDVSFLEERGRYILNVYIDGCRKSSTFVYRPIQNKWKDIWCDTWNIMEHNVQLIGDYNEETWRHYLAEDTTINGTTYTTVNRYWTADKTKRGFVATIRFTEDQKVYALLGDTEYLVYDFSVQVGDTIETIVGVNCGTMLQQLLVHQVDIDDATNRKTIILYPLCQLEEDVDCDHCDENGYYLDLFPIQWIEGVGSTDGFLMGTRPCSDWVGGIGHKLLCAYKDDELQYINDLYQDDYGCEYNAVGQNPENLFPTLWGLQRTSFTEYFDSGHQPESEPVLLQAGNIKEIGGKLYLDFGQYLREENGKIYIYSELLQKDFVLYDFTLELGDTLTTLNWDYNNPNSDGTISVVDYAVDCPIDTLIVTDISTITLLDGKEYKKWIFNHGYFGYVESIGTLSGLFYELSQSCMVVPGCYMGDHLVCASRNGKLLYQMDDEEMERLGAECLCEYTSGPKRDNAKDGQIGGRPTPTQWNQLELDLRKMENGNTILYAETFNYTLENDSIVANGKTFYQLARQSTKDTATTKSFVGALHFGKDEDNRVYFLRDGVEYVLYDFTAEPGDTIEIFAGINNYPQETTYTHVVTGKDTLENGACRMFLEVVFPEETTTATNAEKVWLAGLGSIDGIVHNTATRTSNAHAAPARSAHSSDTQTSVMLCAWRDDNCLYTTDHPDYDTLGCVYNIDEMTAIEDIHTFPSYQKLLRDGQLLIIHEGKTYNVMGIAVE